MTFISLWFKWMLTLHYSIEANFYTWEITPNMPFLSQKWQKIDKKSTLKIWFFWTKTKQSSVFDLDSISFLVQKLFTHICPSPTHSHSFAVLSRIHQWPEPCPHELDRVDHPDRVHQVPGQSRTLCRWWNRKRMVRNDCIFYVMTVRNTRGRNPGCSENC